MKKKLIRFILPVIAGVIYSLAYPSFLGQGWMPLLFVSVPLFLWFLESSSFKHSLINILGFNAGLNLCGYYWVPKTLVEFGQLPYSVSYVLGLLAALILQPHWWVYAIWRKYRPKYQWENQSGIITTAFLLTFLERFVPQQFPSYLGSPWLHMAPYLSLAPIFGVALFSFITYWVSLEVVVQIKHRKFRPMVWGCLFIFIFINSFFPLSLKPQKNKLNARIVQANIGNFLKVSSEKGDQNSYEAIEKIYSQLSLSGEKKVDLIIWPETAYSETFYGKDTKLWNIFGNIMNQTGAEMLIGGYDQNLSKSPWDMIESVYNSSILLSNNKVKSSYHKNILIPFGETLPFGPLNQSIVKVIPAISLFARGTGTPLMETRQGFRFVTPICYEILESNYMRDLLNQWGNNQFIVNHTNDSWYGDTAEPYQHLFLSKWRAIEFGLPIIRSTNTGITSLIYQDGSESKRLMINQVGSIDIEVPIAQGSPSIYQKWGFFPTFLIALIILCFTWWREKNEIQL